MAGDPKTYMDGYNDALKDIALEKTREFKPFKPFPEFKPFPLTEGKEKTNIKKNPPTAKKGPPPPQPQKRAYSIILDTIDHEIIKEIDTEIFQAKQKHWNKFNSRHEGFAILKEEVDELWDVVKGDDTTERFRHEAIQVAAMVIRMIQELK